MIGEIFEPLDEDAIDKEISIDLYYEGLEDSFEEEVYDPDPDT